MRRIAHMNIANRLARATPASVRCLTLCCSLSACDKSSDLQPGDDLTGDWIGCVDDACRELDMAGIRFERDGSLRVIQLQTCEEGERCPDGKTWHFSDGSVGQARRCYATDGEYDQPRWSWRDDTLVVTNLPGVGEVVLAVESGKINPPPWPEGAGYHFSSQFPGNTWLRRVGGRLSDCAR